MTPLRTGIALAATVGLFYALCTLVWVLAPGPFSGARFRSALVVLSGWALLAGLFFGWLGAQLARDAGTLTRSTP